MVNPVLVKEDLPCDLLRGAADLVTLLVFPATYRARQGMGSCELKWRREELRGSWMRELMVVVEWETVVGVKRNLVTLQQSLGSTYFLTAGLKHIQIW